MPENIPSQPPVEPGRFRQLAGRMLDFVIPGRVERRERNRELFTERERIREAVLEDQRQAELAHEARVTRERTEKQERIAARLRAAQQARLEARELFLAQLGASTVVTAIVGANELHFLSQQGDTVHEPVQLSVRGQATRFGDALADMFLDLDSGTHPITAATESLGLTGTGTTNTIRSLATIMPPDVLTYDNRQKTVTLGNITVAGRKATPNERAAYLERAKAAEIARWKDRHNENKVDLGEYDHTLTQTDRRLFYMPLGTTKLILAARLLQALGQYKRGTDQDGHEISLAAWKLMPTTERELFTDLESEIIGDTSVIDAQVYSLLRTLTSRSGMTRQVGTKFRITTGISVKFYADPVETKQAATLAVIFPPGTPLYVIEDFRNSHIPPEDVEMAQYAVTELLPDVVNAVLGHEKAIALLNFIMSQSGKRALQVELAAADSRRNVLGACKSLRRVVKNSLGSGYSAARSSRTIAGGRMIRGARQTGGALDVTTKWYIGLPGPAERNDKP